MSHVAREEASGNITARLVKLIAPFRWWVLLAVLLSFATVGAGVGLMAVSAYLISKAALATEVSQLTLAVTGVRVFAISRAAFRYAERYVTHTATFRILTHLRVWFYQAIEPLAPARLLGYHSGDLLARTMADLETLENFYARAIVPPLSAALVLILSFIFMGSFNIWLGIVVAGFLLLTGAALPLITQWLSRQPSIRSINIRADLNAAMVDEVQGLADILAFGQEKEHQNRIMKLSHDLNHSQERLAIIRGLANGLTALFTGLAGLTVLWITIPMVTGGEIEGVFLALLPLTAIACFEAVAPLSQSLQYLESSKAAGQRLYELIDAPLPITEPDQPARPVSSYDITVNNLSFSYAPGGSPVLDEMSFAVPSGGKAYLVGPSGSGKTTMINLLLRFWGYDSGQIRIGDHDIQQMLSNEVRQLIGVVPQHPYLFNSTIRDNLLLAKSDADDQELVEACKIAQIHDFIDALPNGYFTRIGEDGLLLSGGERQRLAIARALLKDAPILILDEAAAHLDAQTKERLMRSLEDFMDGRTTLIISHDKGPAAHTLIF